MQETYSVISPKFAGGPQGLGSFYFNTQIIKYCEGQVIIFFFVVDAMANHKLSVK